jgi:hypothetical protein
VLHNDTFTLDKNDLRTYFLGLGVELPDDADMAVTIFEGLERAAAVPWDDIRVVVTVSPSEVGSSERSDEQEGLIAFPAHLTKS